MEIEKEWFGKTVIKSQTIDFPMKKFNAFWTVETKQ